MAIEIKAPSFPESVADGTISKWYKKEGDAVKRDEMLVDIETDKVVLEVLAEADGVMGAITKEEGAIVLSNEVLGTLNDGATASAAPAPAAAPASAPASAPAAAPAAAAGEEDPIAAPAARQLAEENGINLASVKGTGKDGRITKEDVVAAVEAKKSAPAAAPAAKPAAAAAPVVAAGDRTEKRVPMTRVRATVAKRLVEAQSNMAMLTTFNEVDMTEVMALRSKYKDLFEKSHNGVRLGFMSFFVKAATEALKRFPAVNASIDGSDIVYHGYADVGVAVSSDRGLVVPVLRNAEHMSLAEIEGGIATFGKKARDGKLSIDEMTGGTFTITNGGTFGSMMSTPIVNPPQAAILGMHNILQRPMAVNGQVVIRPMMYLALSYDHRLIDGKEAVTFLVTIKNLLEDPARLLLDI
ncbi:MULTISPECIES: 2-oxoglutarate dehydrogenase complex dihydrolipoyllysine-residue succinyltransferase [Pseudomonas]|uniref:2-oxoglutarate dehydrogenase complex dihydrolipoyllysine-residue succinyltransferase n=1 Tax=Pseudomonas TaxID=286 RepID=UPI0001E295F9|nr:MULTISPECIES: 2-oxoglutarate dehydrogenase complex dihydrolipoyllysine-residue succinyltransferase [Pseudomonas]KFE46750.1 dihydrolipoamide succinyltransferase [Pseudomonas congelans]MBC8801772.1 2-oxoglutarate dehydrogenase complex dihydrolipoyllysine-residue succinyltransferase [Pseudomonas congelans]MBP1143906.1 2-oxoglutarate dehydrogenase E2 component (dihydrolipoamide succinyltransferase) [Pseudomonas sp. PvP027]MCF5164729.1 2-oxoglutarate dehydrogenase complex dihydrolipoyllysine-resi